MKIDLHDSRARLRAQALQQQEQKRDNAKLIELVSEMEANIIKLRGDVLELQKFVRAEQRRKALKHGK